MKIYVADKETGTFIEQVKTVKDGLKLIAEYEQADRQDGTYEDGFYALVDENHMNVQESMIQYYRLQKNLSQKELAAAAGVSVRLIQDYEQGHRYINNARALLVYKIASALDCNVSDLLELED